MERKFLEDLGLEKEAIDKVMAEHGRDITAAKGELATAQNTIKGLQDTVKKFDGVDVEQLKNDAKNWEAKYNTDVAAAKRDAALNLALSGIGAKNISLVSRLLDRDKITLDDAGKITGLDEQITQLKTDAADLFNVDDGQQTHMNTGGEHGGDGGGAPTGVEAAFLAKNPGLKLD